MALTLRFVDAISASPTLRLDLVSAPWRVDSTRTSFPPPPLERAIASTLLTDGAQIPGKAFGLRTLRLGLILDDDSPDDAAEALRLLFRELSRERNTLEYKVGTANSVFFRTHAAAPETLEDLTDGSLKTLNIEILAEPFAYGTMETLVASQTVNMNPAAGSNGLFVPITGVKGDVETPVRVKGASTVLSGFQSVLAIRRRGTPANLPLVQQAEAMTQGTNTTTQPNDATMSGSGNNYSRCTFTTATMQTRLSTTVYPATDSPDARGVYRVFARLRRSNATDVINVQLNSNAKVATALTANIQIVELGELAIPGGMDPLTDGPSGAELSARGAGLTIKAERISGTATLDFDHFMFFPADNSSDRFALVQWPTTTSANYYVDGYTQSVYATDTTTGAVENSAGFLIGNFPMVTPNQDARLYFLRKVGSLADAVGDAVSLTVEYWPRYLAVRAPGG